MAAAKKGGLGRGLDALFADAVPISSPQKEGNNSEAEGRAQENSGDAVQYINIHDIMPNANQPRKTFSEEKIEELSKSIKEHGIIQPIVVRRKGEKYEIVAGERRWRAARKAELGRVPCLIRELSDEQNMLIAIIENMQREDLNPVEEAEGLHQMIVTFGMTQEQIAKEMNVSRQAVSRWAAGNPPTFGNLQKLAQLLNTTVGRLSGEQMSQMQMASEIAAKIQPTMDAFNRYARQWPQGERPEAQENEPESMEDARTLIDNYIHFCNFERIQLKAKLTPFEKR